MPSNTAYAGTAAAALLVVGDGIGERLALSLLALSIQFGAKQNIRLNAQRYSEPGERFDAWVTCASFKVADVASLDIRFERQFFLGHAFAFAQLTHVSAENLWQLHCHSWRNLSTGICPLIVSFVVHGRQRDVRGIGRHVAKK